MADLFDNPAGLDGFEFIEFSAPGKGVLKPVFATMGFTKIARHRSKDVELWRQGGINLITNYEPSIRRRGTSAASTGRRRAAWASACATRARRTTTCSPGRRARAASRRARWNSTCLHPRHRQARSSTSSTATKRTKFQGALSIYDIDFDYLPGVDRHPVGAGFSADRPPDPQRLRRAHEVLGGLLREAVQLPRDPLLRHQGRIHRAHVQGADGARRQDPHSRSTRKARAARARSRNSCASSTARASSTSRSSATTSSRAGTA
jgi:hypothetical protein